MRDQRQVKRFESRISLRFIRATVPQDIGAAILEIVIPDLDTATYLRSRIKQELTTAAKFCGLGSTMIRQATLCLYLSISASQVIAATITAEPCGNKCLSPSYEHAEITLTGQLEKGDLAKLKKQYATPAHFVCLNWYEPGRYVMISSDRVAAGQEEWRQSHTPEQPHADTTADQKCSGEEVLVRPAYLNGMLLINSPGGDLDEAMAIGQWVRANRLGVVARGRCASACVWILASGLARDIWPHTTILVHRPYLTTDSPDAGEKLRKLLHDSKDYFDKMGVPSELAERMFSTPSDSAAALNRAQISYYRLDQLDFGFQEELDFVRAKNLGLSRDEYMQRRQQYNNLKKLMPCSSVVKAQSETAIVRELNECENSRLEAFGLVKK